MSLSACRLFEYSPYQIPQKGSGTNPETQHHLNRLAQPADPDAPFSFAVLSDIQTRYTELAEGVRLINADTSVRFVLITGDLTQFGLNREYEWVERELRRFKMPWFTVIGNHDAVANGVEIYRRRFGPPDYSFRYGNSAFVLANTNPLEFGCCVPNLPWIDATLAAVADSRKFFVSHIGPYMPELDSATSGALVNMLVRHGVELSVYGHLHSYKFGRLHHPGLLSLRVDNIGSRNFSRLTVNDTGVVVERIFF